MEGIHPVSVVEIRDEIRAISRSSLFAQSRRRIELLEYLCNMVLLGRQDEIKESTIAVEVFDRSVAFDDKRDAIVRVEAHRLRQRLAKYYETEGAQDRVVIELLPGNYVPRFHAREPHSSGNSSVPPVPPPSPSPNFQPNWKLIVIGAALAAFLLGAAISPIHRGIARGRTLSPVADRKSVPLAAQHGAAGAIRILAGSSKPYIDRAGRYWSADRYFHGGTTQPGPSDFLGRPSDPNLYRFMRYGDFSYDIPAPPGVYQLWLRFAEPAYRNATDLGNEDGENQRHFRVTVNGSDLLHDFDVVTDTGVSPVDVRSFRDITPAADGAVHLQFQSLNGSPFLNAIELVPGIRGHTLPIRIHAGDATFTDHDGNTWNPDDYYIGGRLVTHKGDVTGTPDPDLYAGERYGNFSYAIPVPPGRYAVTLYFAETYWDPTGDPTRRGSVGTRVFSVSCNGAMLLPQFDILKLAKPFEAVVRTFHGLRPNGQGKLLISLSPITNYACIKAIEVEDDSGPGLK